MSKQNKTNATVSIVTDKMIYENIYELFKSSPIPEKEILNNLCLFIRRQSMTRVIFMYELYKKILKTHGTIVEFGVRWGQDLALFESFRGMLEPLNYNRRIIGFDTFEGFPSISEKDRSNSIKIGDMNVCQGYEDILDQLLQNHENTSPLAQIKKYELVKGDATKTFKEYLEKHPETIIAFAYFDFDIYEPTKICLDLCKERFTKGSIIGFDEINNPNWPGETIALREILGINNVRIQRFQFMPTGSYIVIE